MIARVVAVAVTAASISLQDIKNFRALRGAASSLPVYRCAALDGATPADVIALASIEGKRLGRVIDLRNDDEIVKGRTNRTVAATDFYRAISNEQLVNRPLPWQQLVREDSQKKKDGGGKVPSTPTSKRAHEKGSRFLMLLERKESDSYRYQIEVR